MATTKIRLPQRQEMLRRLKTILDDRHVEENFYRLLLAEAGKTRSPAGLALLLVQAVHDYTATLPRGIKSDLNALLPDFVKKLVRNRAARAEVLDALRGAGVIPKK